MSIHPNFYGPDFNHEGTDLTIKVRPQQDQRLPKDGIIIEMTGDLNLYSTPALKKIIDRLISAGKTKIYIIMDKLEYIDSSGLGAFLSFQSRLLKIQGFVKLCGPSRQVLSVLELTKLKTMLKVNPNLDEAFKNR